MGHMKIKNRYEALLAGMQVQYAFRYPDTARYMESTLGDKPDETIESTTDAAVISVSEAAFAAWEEAGETADAYAEFCLAPVPTSEVLLRNNRCVFHAAAVSCRGRAWLIAAGSGVGKSTQCRNLVTMYPGEFAVINGDKPVIEARDDGGIIVHPSPWNGKEGWHGAGPDPLAGIVLLRRGSENSLVRATEEKAAWRVFLSVFQDFTDDETIRMAAAMAEKMLKSCPVWLMTSHTVPDSTKLLYECIESCAQGESAETE